MSDSYVVVVPADPFLVPSEEAQHKLMEALRQIVPNVTEISVEVSERIFFISASANFERISCPNCTSELPVAWWQEQMDGDFDGKGFKLAPLELPCCGSRAALNELQYNWPQAFGRFSCTVRNPGVSDLSEAERGALSVAIGAPVFILRCHL